MLWARENRSTYGLLQTSARELAEGLVRPVALVADLGRDRRGVEQRHDFESRRGAPLERRLGRARRGGAEELDRDALPRGRRGDGPLPGSEQGSGRGELHA